jgi:hypothetical protein
VLLVVTCCIAVALNLCYSGLCCCACKIKCASPCKVGCTRWCRRRKSRAEGEEEDVEMGETRQQRLDREQAELLQQQQQQQMRDQFDGIYRQLLQLIDVQRELQLLRREGEVAAAAAAASAAERTAAAAAAGSTNPFVVTATVEEHEKDKEFVLSA